MRTCSAKSITNQTPATYTSRHLPVHQNQCHPGTLREYYITIATQTPSHSNSQRKPQPQDDQLQMLLRHTSQMHNVGWQQQSPESLLQSQSPGAAAAADSRCGTPSEAGPIRHSSTSSSVLRMQKSSSGARTSCASSISCCTSASESSLSSVKSSTERIDCSYCSVCTISTVVSSA